MAVLNFRAAASSVTPALGGQNRGQWGLVTAFGSSTGLTGSGAAAESISEADTTSSLVVNANGHALRQGTAASGGSSASWSLTSTADHLQVNHNVFGRIKFRIDDTSDVRLWIGFSSASGSGMVASDTPNAMYCGLLYSTVRGDAVWQYACGNGSGAGNQTLASSTIAQSTDVVYLEMASDGTPASESCQFTMFSAAGAQLADPVTISTNLPVGSSMLPSMGIATQVAEVRNMDTYFFEWAPLPQS